MPDNRTVGLSCASKNNLKHTYILSFISTYTTFESVKYLMTADVYYTKSFSDSAVFTVL